MPWIIRDTRILGTPDHAQFIFNSNHHQVRRTWSDARELFGIGSLVWDAVYSEHEGYGIMLATDDGVVRLDEETLLEETVAPDIHATRIADGSNGFMYVTTFRDVFRLSPFPSDVRAFDRPGPVHDLEIHPNPTTRIIRSTPRPGANGFRVIDMLGREVLTMTRDELTSGVDVSRLAAGVYIVLEVSEKCGRCSSATFVRAGDR